MFNNIHKKLVLRLALAWCFLSLLIGAAVYFLEHEKIDEFVVSLAEDDSKSFIDDAVKYLDNLTPSNEAILQQKTQEYLLSGGFFTVEFYNKDKKKIIELSRKEFEKFVAEINKLKKLIHTHLMLDKTQYEKIYIADQMFIRVITPLKKTNGTIVGYFEGEYRVEPRIMNDIKGRVLFSLMQVIITVLISTVVLYPIIIALNKSLIRYSIDLSDANMGMLEVLGNAIAKRDSDTNDHNYRVTLYSFRLAEALGLDREKIQELVKGAFLHDVGKIAISDNILLKPGKLTEEEFEIMKTHVVHGEEIIGSYSWLKDAVRVARNHHEQYSGNGYMNGLRGDAIPVTARIFALIDVFDALTSKRPYKEPFTFEKSMNIVNEGKGTHFDPVILDEFNKIAQSLYNKIHGADEKYLRDALRELINKYFNTRLSG